MLCSPVLCASPASPSLPPLLLLCMCGLCAGMTIFILLSVSNLAGVQSKVGQFVRDVVGSDYDPLLGPPAEGNGAGSYTAQPFIPFKGGSHVE